MIDQDAQFRSLLGEVLSHAPQPETAAKVWQRAAEVQPAHVVPSRRARSVSVLIVASAAAALIGGLVAIAANRDNAHLPSTASPAAYSPPGIEIPLVVAPATQPSNEVIKPNSFVHVVVADTTGLSRYTTVAMYEGHVVQMDCFNGACSPFLDSPAARTGLVTDTGTTDIWSWVGVPTDAAYVLYTDADVVLWQRPVAGIAAFPVSAGFTGTVIGVDSTGHTLARADLHTTPKAVDLPPFDWTRYRDLTADQQAQMPVVINDAMTSCLESNTSWNECVDRADQALVQWFDERARERVVDSAATSP